VILHIFKMVWNRKGTNALITLEILISFLVLFAVCALGAYHYDHYRQPLGYTWDQVWKVEISFGEDDSLTLGALMRVFSMDDPEASEVLTVGEVFERMVTEVESFEQVEAAAGMSFAPYTRSSWRWGLDIDDRKIPIYMQNASDSLLEVMDLDMTRGRWFEETDRSHSLRTIVINERLARQVFGREDPIGQVIVDESDSGDIKMKVVGVIADFRYHGELSPPIPLAFMRLPIAVAAEPGDELVEHGRNQHDFLQALVIRVKPGTPVSFEEEIIKRLHAVAPEWSFKLQPLSMARDSYLRKRLAPLAIAALVAAFLMIMVALGLLGVLWQNVTQRIRELGLRRAKGATAGHIRRQVLGELLIMSSLAMVIGVIVIVQLPLTGWVPPTSARVYMQALLLAAGLMSVLTVIAGLYPSFLATRVQPAEALHYE